MLGVPPTQISATRSKRPLRWTITTYLKKAFAASSAGTCYALLSFSEPDLLQDIRCFVLWKHRQLTRKSYCNARSVHLHKGVTPAIHAAGASIGIPGLTLLKCPWKWPPQQSLFFFFFKREAFHSTAPFQEFSVLFFLLIFTSPQFCIQETVFPLSLPLGKPSNIQLTTRYGDVHSAFIYPARWRAHTQA